MADTMVFNEGVAYLGASALPATCYFLLSTKAVSSFVATDTLAGGVAEITGTGYARMNQARPTPATGVFTFTQMTWSTGANVNWPAAVRSVVLVTSSDNSGKAICAGNLVAGGTARDMSAANTTEKVTPVLSFTSGN